MTTYTVAARYCENGQFVEWRTVHNVESLEGATAIMLQFRAEGCQSGFVVNDDTDETPNSF